MPENAFERVLREFRLRLTQAEHKDFAGTTIDELQVTIASIQQRQLLTRTNRNVTRLKKFLEATKSCATVLELFVNVNDFVAFIWGPMKLLLLTASTYVDAFCELLDTYESISREMPLLAQYQALFEKDNSMTQILELLFKSIFDFHLQALRFFQVKRWRQIFKAHGFRAQFGDIIEDLRQHKELVDRQANLLEFREVKKAREQALQHQQNIEEHERLRRKVMLVAWLDAPDTASDQERGRMTRSDRPNSGRWLLSHTVFKAWFGSAATAAECLWIHGIPGAGKTVLASLIVDECMQVANRKTIYFYCQHLGTRKNSFVAMARAFLAQLLDMDDKIVDILWKAAAKSGTTFSTKTATESLLQLCLDSSGPFYIVLDGLDECDEVARRTIAKWLRNYTESSASLGDPSRCVFFSQNDASTKAIFSMVPSIRITAADSRADITAYCLDICQGLQTQFGLKQPEAQIIAHEVAARSEGMFLYAKLVMNNLLDQQNRFAMQAELDPAVFPKGLDQAYRRITSRILGDDRPAYRDSAHRILSFLICATRPMKWREIQCAVSTDTESGQVEPGKRFSKEPKDLCASLVEEQPDTSLQLVHKTARMFLLSESLIVERLEHLNLSMLCLEQFTLPAFGHQLQESDIITKICAGDFAFFDYSIVSWAPHLTACLKPDSSATSTGLSQQQVEGLAETVGVFLDLHWTPARRSTTVPKSVVTTAKTMGQLPVDQSGQLLQVLAVLRSLEASELREPLGIENLKLYEVLRKVRSLTERSISDPTMQAAIEKHYGRTVFKCPRLYCRHFYEGFKTALDRDAHVAKHERAYYCPYIGCSHAKIGCASSKELNTHMEAYHKPALTNNDFTIDQSDLPALSENVYERR